jgi:hypothetical protein
LGEPAMFSPRPDEMAWAIGRLEVGFHSRSHAANFRLKQKITP